MSLSGARMESLADKQEAQDEARKVQEEFEAKDKELEDKKAKGRTLSKNKKK